MSGIDFKEYTVSGEYMFFRRKGQTYRQQFGSDRIEYFDGCKCTYHLTCSHWYLIRFGHSDNERIIINNLATTFLRQHQKKERMIRERAHRYAKYEKRRNRPEIDPDSIDVCHGISILFNTDI